MRLLPPKETLEWMLAELLANHLVVCKVPGRRGGYKRHVVSCNARWYQELCGRYVRPRGRWRKVRTVIRRRTTVIALKRLIAGGTTGVYAERILEVAGGIGCQ